MPIKYSPGGQGCPGGYSFNPTAAGYTGTLLDDLVSWWSLDEESGTRADSVGSGDLSDNNTVLYDTGIDGNAASFVATNSEFLSVASPYPQSEADFTIAGWINPDALSGVHIIFASGDGTGAGEWQIWHGAAFTIEVDGGGSASGAPVPSDDWQHVLLIYTTADKKLRLYSNGADTNLVATGAGTGAYNAGKTFCIGAWASSQYHYTGLIDEVGFWSRALTADEIAELYASGAGVYYPFT